jgi:ParB-like chromosome segregation protein Spo0J
MAGELQHETWPITRLIEYGHNPRINDHAVEKIAAAISEFGFRVPVLVKSDGLVIDGHLRLKAARKLGMTNIPVILADDLTEAQIKAFRISVNKMAELAEWDEARLLAEYRYLQSQDFDMALIDFDLESIDDGIWLNQTAVEYQKKEMIEVICPNCARTFNVKRPEK